MYKCLYCNGNHRGRTFLVREMMFGLNEQFEYFQCSQCESLQISEVPGDISKYYPKEYYSYVTKRDSAIKRWLKRQWFLAAWEGKGLLGQVLIRQLGIPPYVQWLKLTGVRFSDAILDVGSGGGAIILQMHNAGFMNLTGVDPYIERNLQLSRGVNVLKRELCEVPGRYNLIMFNHSLEHVPSPADALSMAGKLLEPGKYVAVRLPVVGGYAWREYGTDWVQLDSPRHLSIPTVCAMERLAQRTGFKVEQVLFESTGFQFWGSEQYRQDIPLRDERSYARNPQKSIFSETEIKTFNLRAIQLNTERDGDEACFLLRKQ